MRTRTIKYLLSLFALSVSMGCGLLPHKQAPAGFQTSLRPDHSEPQSPPITQRELQAQVMRFADRFLNVIDDCSHEVGKSLHSPEARAMIQHFHVEQVSAAVTIAAGPNPTVNLVDLMALLRLQCHFWENHWVPEVYGEDGQCVLTAYRRMENEIWAMSRNVLKPGQRRELEAVIHDWLTKNPDSHPTGHIPFDEFAREAGRYPEGEATPTGSIFSLLFLDPLASLDPTRRAIESSKYLAERSMFYLQHMPRILQEQMQLTFLELAQTREVVGVQSQAERLTRTAETFARTTERLPDQFREERQAAVQQVLDGVSAERERFIRQILSEKEDLEDSLKELRETFVLGKEMASNVTGAGHALSGFVDRIEAARLRPSPGTNSHPFDIREYGAAGKDIGVGAAHLNSLLSSMNERGREMNQVLAQTRQQGEEFSRHLFKQGLLLGSLLITQLFLALLVYRFVVERVIRRRTRLGTGGRIATTEQEAG